MRCQNGAVCTSHICGLFFVLVPLSHLSVQHAYAYVCTDTYIHVCLLQQQWGFTQPCSHGGLISSQCWPLNPQKNKQRESLKAQPMPLSSFPRLMDGHTYLYFGIVALSKFVSKLFLLLCQLVWMFEFKAHDLIGIPIYKVYISRVKSINRGKNKIKNAVHNTQNKPLHCTSNFTAINNTQRHYTEIDYVNLMVSWVAQ